MVEVREAQSAVLEAKLKQAQAKLEKLSVEALGDKETLIVRLQVRPPWSQAPSKQERRL